MDLLYGIRAIHDGAFDLERLQMGDQCDLSIGMNAGYFKIILIFRN